jgi:type II secretory pathway pseudopilin PulG
MLRRSGKRGFSMLELAVVNGTIAVLATIAIPRLQRSLNRARAVEAIQVTNTIARLMVDYYNRNGQYPSVNAAQNPPQPVPAGKVAWAEDKPGWIDINFKSDGQSYQYRYEFTTTYDASAQRYTQAVIHAFSDVDGNGINGHLYIYLQDGSRILDSEIEE